MVRERFTVQGGDKVVKRLWARLGKKPGYSVTGPVTLRLEDGGGSLIAGGECPGSSAIADWAARGETGWPGTSGTWVSYTLPNPATIKNGSTYNLRISAPSGSAYQTFIALDQDSSDLSGAHQMWSYSFREGQGEYSTDSGSSWTAAYGTWYHNNTQSFLELAP